MATPHKRFQRGGRRPLPEEPWRERLLAATPADKFTSPSEGLDHGAWLNRPRVNEIIDRAFHRHSVVCLSAGPGSGKSVAAAQFIDIQGDRGLWYRLGKEDRQPEVVLGSLVHLLQKANPGFSCPAAETLLAEPDRENDPQRLIGVANTLLHELSDRVEETLYLAVDDFQELEPSSPGARLLLHVLATLPRGVKCLCVSRHPVAALRAHVRPEQLTEIGGGAVGLTPEETQELCRMFLQTALPSSLCREIHDRALGWVRGVVAYVQALERQLLDEGASATADPLAGAPSAELLGLDAYFEHHVVRRLDPPLRTRLCELCWLDELTPELVARALGIDDVAGLLSRLFSLGLLLRATDTGRSQLQLHPLFEEYLRRRAQRSLPAERPREILIRAADWLVNCGRYEAALDCLLRADAHDGAEAVVREHGMQLLATGHFRGLLERLDRLPINRVAASSWLLLIQGIALLEVDPVHALSPLQQAMAAFKQARDTQGEMLCLAQQITYHAGVDGAYFRIPPLLTRLEALHRRERKKLAPFPGVLTDVALAAGYMLFHRVERVEPLLAPALEQAQALDAANLEARIRIVRCYGQLQGGELRSAAIELERLAAYRDHAETGEMAKALIQALQCHYLNLSDRPVAFAHHRHRFLRTHGQTLHRQTLAAPLLCRWAGENALRAGRYDDAWTEVENGLSIGYAASNPNLRSQFLLYRALLLALRREHGNARTALDDADPYFERFGAGPFEAERALLTAAVHTLTGDANRAARWLQRAQETASRLGARHILAGVHAYAAYLALQTNELQRALSETQALLDLIREHRFSTYYLCEPHTAGRVLAFAAKRGIRPEVVDHLARRLLGVCFDKTGQAIPLLRMYLLGDIHLRCMGNLISGDHLSRRERTYVATLAGADHQQIDRERLIEALWPGGEHTSANVYVVRNRLKKSLQRAAPQVEASRYFTMTSSVVRLENSWVDAAAYRQQVEKGLSHWIRGEHWQAECEFLEADALWHGHYAQTVQENDLIRDHRLMLQRLTERKAMAWSALLAHRGAHREAESVLEDFLSIDPINEEAVKRLFRLRRDTHSISLAERTLTRYRRQLEAEHFGFREIERTIEAIRSGA